MGTQVDYVVKRIASIPLTESKILPEKDDELFGNVSTKPNGFEAIPTMRNVISWRGKEFVGL